MSKTNERNPSRNESLPDRPERADHHFEETFFKRHPVLWLATLLGPFVLTGAILVLLYLMAGGEFVLRLLGTALATFFFLGRFAILVGAEGGAANGGLLLTAEQAFLMVLYMDLLTAWILVFHTGFLFRLPVVGTKMGALVEDGRFILETNRWMKRVTFIGLIAFVMFPLAATGSIGGSIFGRLLGMSRLLTFIGVAIGSVLGCGIMYLGNLLLGRFLERDNPILFIGGMLFIIVLILLLNYRYRQMKARHLAGSNQGSPGQ